MKIPSLFLIPLLACSLLISTPAKAMQRVEMPEIENIISTTIFIVSTFFCVPYIGCVLIDQEQESKPTHEKED